MKRYVAIVLMLCLLTGCGWLDGSHVTVTDHKEKTITAQSSIPGAGNYMSLVSILEELVEAGTESAVINVSEYDPDRLEKGVEKAVRYIREEFPLGAYAVEKLTYEIGASGGQTAVQVSVAYIHGRSEIRQIQSVEDMEDAKEAICHALENCGEGLVILVDRYTETDIAQMVEDFSEENPQTVMETPAVALGVYPESGQSRVLEVKFTYKTSRDVLRQMQSQVQRVFNSAVYYIDQSSSDEDKFLQIYDFLMERFVYVDQTSITPSYSLLIHGVGDQRAFATVYAAMCRQAGLECVTVTGTRDGSPRSWNLVRCAGEFFHLDVLACHEAGEFSLLTDDRMEGYVWDYSAYSEQE